MNEFKIIISAVNKAAKQAIKEVKEEIDKANDAAKKGGKSISDSMKSVAKGTKIAVAAISGVTTALVAFGRSTLETQKEIARLNAAFESSGSSAKQAGETYKSIFGFLGDSGAAVEAAQQLAYIPTDDIKAFEKILQGVYATFGTSIETGGLAEGINHTIQLGEVQGTLADAFEFAGVSVDSVNAKLATFNSTSEREAYLRSTLLSMYGASADVYARNNAALIANNQSQANLNITMAQAGNAILPLMTAVNNLATSLLSALSPAIAVVSQMLAILVGWISTAVSWISSFFSLFSGGKGATKEVADSVSKVGTGAKSASSGVGGLNKALGGAAKAAKELKKQTMGFDELNVIQSPDASASGGAGGAGGGGGGGIGGISMPDMSNMLPDLSTFNVDLEKARGIAEALLALIGAAALGFGLWKITNMLTELGGAKELLKVLGGHIQSISGVLLIVAGAVLLVKGYCDAWVNGINWGNFATILSGMGLIIAGLALKFGTVAAGVGTLASGIALVILGVKDFVKNGYSMESVLTILAGVLLTIVGVCLAFNAALLANPITWVIAAIAALVAAFVILWNECDGFRNFWIQLWEKVKELFAAFVKSMQPLIDALVNAFKAAWELIKVIWNDYLVPLFKAAWEAIKVVWDLVKPYFEALWNSIKQVFSVVKTYFEGMFKTAWEAIKLIWNAVVGYFTAIWNSIAGIFSVVKDVLTGNWKGAWDGIKGIVNTWKSYFSGVWNDIKNVFSSVQSWFSNTFSAAWTAVKNVFSTWGSFFSGLWNTIKNTFSALGTNIGNAISGAVKSGINGVISMIEKTINSAIGLINGAINLINKLPGVSVGKVSKLSLPRLAKGGVVDTATIAMIGEAGKEAVVPLENNTQWMDALADKIASRNGNPTKVILKVGEKELGWATIGAINGITEQTGGLQLVL